MKILITGTLVALAMLEGMSSASAADDKDAKATIKTVFVDGHGQSSMADKVNKVHADMAAKVWKFVDLDIYIENEDMQGFFVTYVREPAPTP